MSINIKSKQYKVNEENSILMRLLCEDKDIKLDVNFFLELFLPNGFFHHYLENLYGVSTFNFQKSIFQVTFTKETHISIINYLLSHYEEKQQIITKTGIKIYLMTKKPEPPARRITLYPMPFNITDDLIKDICQDWGKIRNYEYGRHKICPQIRNPYLHIFIKDPLLHNIPSIITINEKSVTVTIEGQERKPRCIYCKSTTHLIEACPIKPRKVHRPSYAGILTMQKPAPEINKENYPSLSQETKSTSLPTTGNIYTQLTDEGTSTDEEHSTTSDEEPKSPIQTDTPPQQINDRKRKTPPSSPSPSKATSKNHQSKKKVVLRKPGKQK